VRLPGPNRECLASNEVRTSASQRVVRSVKIPPVFTVTEVLSDIFCHKKERCSTVPSDSLTHAFLQQDPVLRVLPRRLQAYPSPMCPSRLLQLNTFRRVTPHPGRYFFLSQPPRPLNFRVTIYKRDPVSTSLLEAVPAGARDKGDKEIE
jgi:hypothetical protein